MFRPVEYDTLEREVATMSHHRPEGGILPVAVTQGGTPTAGHLEAEPTTSGGGTPPPPSLVPAGHNRDATHRPNALGPTLNATNVVRVRTGPLTVMQAGTLSAPIRDTKIRWKLTLLRKTGALTIMSKSLSQLRT